MDTHGYIIWIHNMDTCGAQEPGCGTKLRAGPWARGPWALGQAPMALAPVHGPWPWARVPGPRAQFCATAWLLGPHMYPFYVSMCVHMYIDVSICMLMYALMYRYVSICMFLFNICWLLYLFQKYCFFLKSSVEICWNTRFVRDLGVNLLAWCSNIFIYLLNLFLGNY